MFTKPISFSLRKLNNDKNKTCTKKIKSYIPGTREYIICHKHLKNNYMFKKKKKKQARVTDIFHFISFFNVRLLLCSTVMINYNINCNSVFFVVVRFYECYVTAIVLEFVIN